MEVGTHINPNYVFFFFCCFLGKWLCGWCRVAKSMHDIFSYFLYNLQMIWIFSLLGCLKKQPFQYPTEVVRAIQVADNCCYVAISNTRASACLIHSKMFWRKLLTKQVLWPDFQRRNMIHFSKYLLLCSTNESLKNFHFWVNHTFILKVQKQNLHLQMCKCMSHTFIILHKNCRFCAFNVKG